MMNGVLLSSGHDAISIPFSRRLEFNQSLVTRLPGRGGDAQIRFRRGHSLAQPIFRVRQGSCGSKRKKRVARTYPHGGTRHSRRERTAGNFGI